MRRATQVVLAILLRHLTQEQVVAIVDEIYKEIGNSSTSVSRVFRELRRLVH